MAPGRKQAAVVSEGAVVRTERSFIYPPQSRDAEPPISDTADSVPLCRAERLAISENQQRAAS